jgi:hypothetical protein
MLNLKTHFEQIPLETVRKMVEEQMRREPPAEQCQDTENKTVADDNLAPQKLSIMISSTSSQREL